MGGDRRHVLKQEIQSRGSSGRGVFGVSVLTGVLKSLEYATRSDEIEINRRLVLESIVACLDPVR